MDLFKVFVGHLGDPLNHLLILISVSVVVLLPGFVILVVEIKEAGVVLLLASLGGLSVAEEHHHFLQLRHNKGKLVFVEPLLGRVEF